MLRRIVLLLKLSPRPAGIANFRRRDESRDSSGERGGRGPEIGLITEAKWANVAIRAPFQKNPAIPILGPGPQISASCFGPLASALLPPTARRRQTEERRKKIERKEGRRKDRWNEGREGRKQEKERREKEEDRRKEREGREKRKERRKEEGEGKGKKERKEKQDRKTEM